MSVKKKSVVLASLGLVMLLAAAAIAVTPDSCQNGIVDVNECGGYPPPGTCVLLNWDVSERGCCGRHKHQYLLKEWYDCTGSGTASCEYDIWYAGFDSNCL